MTFYDWTGALTYVAIDDKIPILDYSKSKDTKREKYEFLMNKPSEDGAYWLVILEKAFAKLNVNYLNLNGGHASEALR